MDFSFLQTFFFEYGYYAVFGVLLLCGMGLPVPEDITLVTAGVISALGSQNIHVMFVVAYLGVMVGDSLMYGIGWHFGPHIRQKKWFAKLLSPERMDQIDSLFRRYGNRLIFVARFLPGLRAPIYVMTGITRRVKYWQFALMDGFAAIISVPVFVYVGYFGASNHEWLMEKMREFKYLTIAIVLIVIGIVIYYLWKRKKRKIFFRETRARLKALRKSNAQNPAQGIDEK